MNPINTYLTSVPIAYRESLETLRSQIRAIFPNSEECLSYGMPAFKVGWKAVAGFSAFKNHLSFFPFSGSVLDGFREELKDFEYTKSGIHFTPEKPIPEELLRRIIEARMKQI
jgi:uncharacterized protein YdhG (YjbR/CyaY superfamily)